MLGDDGAALLAAARAVLAAKPRDALAAASALRRGAPGAAPTERAAALGLAAAGAAFAAKLAADRPLVATREAVEQATAGGVATWRASLVPEGSRVLEIGSGCGADTLAFARRAATVTAAETDPVRAACVRWNAAAFGLTNVNVVEADGLLLATDGADVLYADPDRRPGGVRTLDTERWRPALSHLTDRAGGGRVVMVKCAPAIDIETLDPRFDVVFVSYRRSCVEALLVHRPGESGGIVRAVRVDADGVADDLSGDRGDAPVTPVGSSLYVPDPAAIRASLLAELCARHDLGLVSEGIAFLSGPSSVASPWLREHPVLRVLPLGLPKLRAALRECGAARIRVHVRGLPITAELLDRDLRRALDPRGGGPDIDVFAARVAGTPTTILTSA